MVRYVGAASARRMQARSRMLAASARRRGSRRVPTVGPSLTVACSTTRRFKNTCNGRPLTEHVVWFDANVPAKISGRPAFIAWANKDGHAVRSCQPQTLFRPRNARNGSAVPIVTHSFGYQETTDPSASTCLCEKAGPVEVLTKKIN